LEISAATNQALAVLHAFDEERVDPKWISLFLEGRYEETRNQAAGGVQPNLSLGIVKAIRLPLPSLAEQRAAIRATDLAFVRADRLETEAARARAMFDRLESAILNKAFRGELVPQDPNDEPASVLLERIRAPGGLPPPIPRGRTRAPEHQTSSTRTGIA
jgi:type I restriction enzyme S subunit